MINDVPTIFEVVTGSAKQPKDQSATPNNGSKSKFSGKVVSKFQFHVPTLHVYITSHVWQSFLHLFVWMLPYNSPANLSLRPRE